MNTKVTTFPKSKTHPMIIIGAIAVVLFCTAGIAAIMGWIPTSRGSNPDITALGKTEQAPAKQATHQATHLAAHRAEPAAVRVASVKVACSYCGVVESTREISTRAEGSGVGAAGGAVVGGLLGNQVGGGHGKEAMTVVGAIGGAVIGNQIEGKIKATRSYETTVRLEDGSVRAIQQADQPTWSTGDRVKIVDGVVRRSNA